MKENAWTINWKMATLAKSFIDRLRRVVEWIGTNECLPKLILLMLLTATCYKIKLRSTLIWQRHTKDGTLSVGERRIETMVWGKWILFVSSCGLVSNYGETNPQRVYTCGNKTNMSCNLLKWFIVSWLHPAIDVLICYALLLKSNVLCSIK